MWPILFSVGDFQVPAYGTALFVAFTVATLGSAWVAGRRGINSERMLDLALIAVVGGIVGGRMEYIRTHWAEKFVDDPARMLEFNDGGMVFYGGLGMGLLGCLLYAWVRKLEIGRIADIAGVSIPLAIGITRLGCFGSGCCYGGPSSLPWAVTYPMASVLAPGGVPLHPTPLYETAYTWAIAFGVYAYTRSRFQRTPGEGLLMALVGYSVFRSLNEGLRADAERGWMIEGWLTNGQGTSLVLAAVCLVIWAGLRRMKPA